MTNSLFEATIFAAPHLPLAVKWPLQQEGLQTLLLHGPSDSEQS